MFLPYIPVPFISISMEMKMKNIFLQLQCLMYPLILFLLTLATEDVIKAKFESDIPHRRVRFTATKLNIADTGSNTLGMLPKPDYRCRQSVANRQSPLGTLHVQNVLYFHSHNRIY